ncbi:hypothetical protein PHYBOEH_007272 [Phytophthora boehmeriae]|uniref:MABP domain-containing protein n=1 Tax=Phytophthora boehmeriae TaxID=109152 RepID=A0A8T1XCP3_9STRA|nr:hypothetical protein PHYBOEH_007272 [Phytophthora boehmeriae]
MVTMMEDTNEESMPITELMVKVALSTDPKPSMQGFERVELDLNVGGGATSGGKKQVYLFYRREPNGSPITDLQVVYNTEAIPDGFKQIQVDINQGDGSKVFLCYRCDMPITDLKIVNSGIPGYRMVDHLLNVSHEDALKQYLALKVGGHDPCLTGLKLVDGSNVAKYQEEGWQSIGSPFSFTQLPEPTLNEDPFVPPQLMVRRGHGNPIFAIDVFRAPRQVPKYNDYEVIKLVQTGDSPTDTVLQLKGDWMGNEDTERGRKAVRVKSVSEPISNALLVKGALDDKGELSCVATRVSTWSGLIGTPNSSADGAMSAGNASNTGSSPVYRVSGYWKSSKVLSAQLFDVELRPALNGMSCAPDDAVIDLSQNNPSLYAINGTIGDGRGKPIAIHGVQRSRKVKIKWPISKILVLRGDERVPEGVQVIRETCSCRSGNLLAQTASPHTLYLAVMREEAPNSGYISDICVIYGEIDAVPENYTCIQTTPAGHSANLNDGTSGVPVFICYRHSGSVDEGVTSSSGSTPKVLMNLALMWTSGAQPDSLPTGFTKIQHTPLGMEANLNQGTSGVAIHICYSKFAEKDVVQPIENMINGEYEITSAPLPAFGRFLSLSVVEELEEARAVEANFGTVLHAQLPGAMSANSGHYYSFCRESDESTRQLHLEDSPLSPWIKFNDMKVERSDWKEINRLVTSTVSDTVYLLLYKKLSYDPPCTETDTELGEGATTDGGSDDEEAMLLAKAMALSMSAAKQNQQRRAEDEESKGESEAGTDIVERETLSTNLTTKALLKKVEEENMVFLRESLTATSSALHADDLHTLLVLRHSLPLHLRSLLDEIC